MKLGTKVVHRIYGFEGEIVEVNKLANQCKIQITKGNNPVTDDSDTYIASLDMVQEVEEFEKDYAEFEKKMDEVLSHLFSNILEEVVNKDVEEDEDEDDVVDVFAVEVEQDGAVFRFKEYKDFVQFAKDMQ